LTKLKLLDYANRDIADNATIKTSAISNEISFEDVPTITERMRAMPTRPMPVIHTRQVSHKPVDRMPWLVGIVASVVSICATVYYYNAHEILIYGDAVSHLIIGRRVIDSATPGIAQLGGVWLPLPHVLILLFAWNDYLWQTGLAGSFVGMICYLITAIYIFLTARRITHSNAASFVGTLVFILNPNILYLQSTPMTEPVCWATFTMSCYYMLAWVQEEKIKYLFLASAATFLATMARYDGWVLVLVLPSLILVIGLIRRFDWHKIEAYLLTFGIFGSIGVILWLLWGQIIFGNALYFQRGPFSSQTQTNTGALIAANSLVKHNLLGSIYVYGIDVIEILGVWVILLSAIALLLFLVRRRKSVDALGAVIFLVPYAFYIIALYTGQVALFDNHAVLYLSGIIPASADHHLFNSRFGTEMVAPASIFVATLIPVGLSLRKWVASIGYGLLISGIVLQSLWVAQGGVISVQSNMNPPFCVGSYPLNVYLSQHYDGGYILQTEYPFHISEAEAGIHFDKIVWEGSSHLWYQALQHPEAVADWVIFEPGDSVSQAITRYDPSFTSEYTLVDSTPWSLNLYHRNGLPPLPTRPISPLLLSEQHFCSLNTYGGNQ
jgi:hypothetical protein